MGWMEWFFHQHPTLYKNGKITSIETMELNPRFQEMLMGLPAGHVTDVKISRNDELKALGNGVVPQQSAEATRRWLRDVTEAAA